MRGRNFSGMPMPSSLISTSICCSSVLYMLATMVPLCLPYLIEFSTRFNNTCLIFSLSANTISGDSHPFLIEQRMFFCSATMEMLSNVSLTRSWMIKFCFSKCSSPLSSFEISSRSVRRLVRRSTLVAAFSKKRLFTAGFSNAPCSKVST